MTTQVNFATDPRAVRRKLGLNQQDFWSRIGVTQSGGSRYESGRRMPKPVLELLRVVHVERIDLSQVNREDVDLIEFLKKQQPEVYADLRSKIGAVDAAVPATPSLTTLAPMAQKQPSAKPKAVVRPALSDAYQDDLEDSDYEYLDSGAAGDSRWSDERAPVYEEAPAFQARRRR